MLTAEIRIDVKFYKIMKIRNLFFVGFTALSLAVACDKKEDGLTGSPSISLSTDAIEFEQTADSENITLSANRDWVVQVPESASEWLSVSPASGAASGDPQTVAITVKENTGANRSAKLEFNASLVSATLTVSQAGPEGDISGASLTIAEFIEKPEDPSVYYQLTGEITDLYNEMFGNFTLVDKTGSVSVYGLTATQQSENDKSFASLGLKEGDYVTLMGVRSSYEGKPQVGGPAYYVSHTSFDDMEVTELASIAEVYTTDAVKVSVKGQVVAAGNVSFVLNDGGDKSLYVYANKAPGVTVGDNVKVTGQVAVYPGYVNPGVTIGTKMTQIASPTVEKISETLTPAAQTPKELSGAELASFSSESTQFVKVSATVQVSEGYTNLVFDNNGGTGSVVSSSFDSQISDGDKLIITGYYGGRNGRGYFNILPTDIQDNNGPYLTVSTKTVSVGSAAGTAKFDIKGNVAWTAVSSDDANFSLSSGQGTGSESITVTYTANESEDSPRTATITVSTEDASVAETDRTHTITITQSAKTAPAEGVITIDVASIEASMGVLAKSGYSGYETEKAGSIGGVEFACCNIGKNPKDGNVRVDDSQFIQIKKIDGYIANKTAAEIKSLKVYVVDKDHNPDDNDKDLTAAKITLGTTMNPDTDATYTSSVEKITVKGDAYDGDQEFDMFVYDVTLSGTPTYFSVRSADGAIWVYKIEVSF